MFATIRPTLCAAAMLLGAAASAETPPSVVGLRNAESSTLLVEVGKRDGVRPESDFEVLSAEGKPVALLYPAELLDDHFWSQALNAEVFDRVRGGMTVRPTKLDRLAHDRLRREGEARRAALAAERARERKEAVRAELEELRERRRSLLRQRDALEERIASREKDLIGAESRSGRIGLSQEGDVDRALETLENLADERDELQSRRDVLAEQDPLQRSELDRLSTDIERLNDRMESERRRIRIARDRRRAAESSYLSAKEDWRRLLVDLDDYDRQIGKLSDRIRELEGEL